MFEHDDWWSLKPYRMWLRRFGGASWFTLGIIAIVTLIFLDLMATKSLVLPIVIAAALGVIFLPLVNFLARWHVPRWLGAVICIIIIALVAGTVAMIVHGIATQGESIVQTIEDAFADIETWLGDARISQDIAGWAESSTETAYKNLTGGFASKLFNGLASMASLGLGMFLSFFILFFVLNYAHRGAEKIGAVNRT
ncbi:MAG: AI-2E family transporter [Actinomycetota bacterium]